MQLGKALVGAVIGAAVGVGLLVAIHKFTGLDQYWLSILVALTTGVGVRAMVAAKGHESYFRGLITCLLALGAFMLGTMLFAKVATLEAAKQAKLPAPQVGDVAPDATEGTDATEPAAETEVTAKPVVQQPGIALGPKDNPKNGPLNTIDYVWLGIAGLVAYLLGRGSAPDPRAGQPMTPPPDAA